MKANLQVNNSRDIYEQSINQGQKSERCQEPG